MFVGEAPALGDAWVLGKSRACEESEFELSELLIISFDHAASMAGAA
jgi:hypothetical protein